MRRPISASERKGIIAVATVALAVILAGVVFRQCSRPEGSISPADVKVIMDADSASASTGNGDVDAADESKGKSRKDYRKNGKDRSGGRLQKTYRRRSPIDEPV